MIAIVHDVEADARGRQAQNNAHRQGNPSVWREKNQQSVKDNVQRDQHNCLGKQLPVARWGLFGVFKILVDAISKFLVFRLRQIFTTSLEIA